MDNVKIHTVFRNASSLMSNLEDKVLFVKVLTMATRLLYWESGLRIWSLSLFASRKVQLAEAVYTLCMAPRSSWAPGGLHRAVQQRLAAMASQVQFSWQEDPNRKADGSAGLIGPQLCCIYFDSRLKNELARARPGTWLYSLRLMTLAVTLVHELAHAAKLLRHDHNPEKLCVLDGCESSEEGFELENALWGGILTEAWVSDLTVRDLPVPQLLQWPDTRVTGAYGGPSGNVQILCRSEPSVGTWHLVKYGFLKALVESRADTALRRPGPEDFAGYFDSW